VRYISYNVDGGVMSTVYPLAKQDFEIGILDIMGNPVRIALCSGVYVYNAAHKFRSSLAGVLATSDVLINKSNDNGTFRAANITLPLVADGDIIQFVIGYIDLGGPSVDRLVWMEDGLTSPTNGADVVVHFNSGPSGIFTL